MILFMLIMYTYKWSFYTAVSTTTLAATPVSVPMSPSVTSNMPSTPGVAAANGMYTYACMHAMYNIHSYKIEIIL